MKTTLLTGILAFCAAAQTPTEPPLLIQLIRTPGTDARALRPYSNAGAGVNVFGMTSITGAPEMWNIEAHDSFGGIEALDRAISSATAASGRLDLAQDDVLGPSRTLIALYREDWSFRPDIAIKMLPRARYLYVSIYRIRPGTELDFAELARVRRLVLDRINLDMPDIAYQVISGAPSGTYVFLAPLASLRTIDAGLARGRVGGEPATGHGEKASKIVAVTEITHENLLFRVEPRISYVSDDFASADPEFWRTKPREQ